MALRFREADKGTWKPLTEDWEFGGFKAELDSGNPVSVLIKSDWLKHWSQIASGTEVTIADNTYPSEEPRAEKCVRAVFEGFDESRRKHVKLIKKG